MVFESVLERNGLNLQNNPVKALDLARAFISKFSKMNKELKARLDELKEEYKKGQERLVALEQETTNLSNTMLRISGAIQVLEELIGDEAIAKNNNVNSDLQMAKSTAK